MHGISFLQDLAMVMIVAGLVTVLFHRLKQPVVLGYIIAGIIIGPHTPPFPLIKDEATITTLAELGIIFLMFSLGLEFNLRKLKKVGGTALIASLLEIFLMVWLGYQAGRLFGWSTMDSIFLGAMLSISSTTIIIKALEGLKKTKERFSELIFGILIIEDIMAIVMIALLSGIGVTGSLQSREVLYTIGQLCVFLVATLVVGLIVVPRLLDYVDRFESNEMLLVTVLGLCFGVSLLAARLEYSVALGAFMIGAVIAEARQISKIEMLMEPLRDMFSAVFFVAIGLMINPAMLWEYAVPIAVVTIIVVVGKVITCSCGSFLAGNDLRTSVRVGMGLAQIGEFSFIIATLGMTLKITSDFLYPIAVTVSAITTLLTPYLIRGSDGVVHALDRVLPKDLLRTLEVYTHWVSRLNSGEASLARKLVRRWLLQIALNVVLVCGIFIGANFFEKRTPEWLTRLMPGSEEVRTVLWTAAMVFSLPLLIATGRKLQALGLLIGEVSGRNSGAGTLTASRMLIAQVVTVSGVMALGVLVLMLSSSILPPLRQLMLLLLVLAGVSFLLWRFFVQIYAKAQIALQETLAAKKVEHSKGAALPGILKSARLQMVEIKDDSHLAGKRLRDIQLRSATGASIVGVERAGESIVNPGADEEIRPGDQILLLGNEDQIRRARDFLETGPPTS